MTELPVSINNIAKSIVSFPDDPDLRKKWIEATGRKDWTATKYCKICSNHFPDNLLIKMKKKTFLHSDAVPNAIEKDIENLVKYRLVGGTLKLKPNINPHKFECQKAMESKTEQGAFEKRRRIEFYEIPSTSSQSSSFQSLEMIECDKMELNETEDPLPEDIIFTESVTDNRTNKKRNKQVQEVSSPSGNEFKVFCPKCNTEVQHTAAGIQKDQTKILIAKVYHYFECEYEELKKLYGDLDLTPLSKFRQRTALATGVSETKVLQILKEEEERNAEKRQEKKRSSARKRSIRTENSSEEESSNDNVGDAGQPSYEQPAQSVAEVETLVVKLEPECDKDQGQTNTFSVQVKAEPPDDDVNYTNETLALTEPAATKRKGSKIPRRSDVTSTQQHTHGESSTSAASSSVRLKEVLDIDESGPLGETDVKMEEIEIGDEEFS